jgi:hypothetical protein
MRSNENRIIYIPAGPDRPELNPETAAALEDLVATAAREIAERNQRANESANVWADAFEKGGEEAAHKALKEHLRKYRTSPPDEE